MIIGALVGLTANILGLIFVGFLTGHFSNRGGNLIQVIDAAHNEGFLGKLISLGAVLNLVCFFYFLKQNQDSRAAGVLAATILTAVVTFIIKL